MILFLISACGNSPDTTGNNADDGNTKVEMIVADLVSARTYAEIDGDVVNYWVEPTEHVRVAISGSEPTFYVQTIYTEDVASDSKATVDHYEGSVHFVSETINVDDIDSDNPLTDCVDLKGSWIGKYEGYSTEYPFTFDSSSCNPSTAMDEDVAVDGFYFTSEGYEGLVSEDGNTIQLINVKDRSIRLNVSRE